MKLLRSPIVVVLLAIAALALVFKNVVWPVLGGPRWARMWSKAAHTATAVTSKPVDEVLKQLAIKPAETGKVITGSGIDLAAARSGAARWVVSPRRDPFQGRVRPRNAEGAYPLAIELLTLQGIWMQPGSKLAVVNSNVFSEGDKILEFRIEAIENDHIWVQGPNGREQVDFRSVPVAQTNRPPDLPEKPVAETPKSKP